MTLSTTKSWRGAPLRLTKGSTISDSSGLGRRDRGLFRLGRRAGEREIVDVHRLGDVLERDAAAIGEQRVDVLVDRRVHRLRQADAAGVGDLLQPGGDVDAVAEDVVALDDYIAEMHSHAEDETLVGGDFRVAFGHQPLHPERRAHCVEGAGELEQQPIAGGFDDAAAIFEEQRVDDLAMRLQRVERALFVCPHEPAVAHHIGTDDARWRRRCTVAMTRSSAAFELGK